MKAARRTFLFELRYRGGGFHGVWPQPGLRTVGGELFTWLQEALRERPRAVSFAARTDAGVSAEQNFVSFHLGRGEPDPALRFAPPRWPDLSLTRAFCVSQPMQARNAARSKRYVYRLRDGASAPAQGGDAWQIDQRLDVAAMRRAAGALVGEHDFASFRAKGCAAKTTVRRLTRLDVSQDVDGIQLAFEGDGFLRKGVRILVGTLVEVGLGQRATSDPLRVLQARDPSLAGSAAPAHGLCLTRVELDTPEAAGRGFAVPVE